MCLTDGLRRSEVGAGLGAIRKCTHNKEYWALRSSLERRRGDGESEREAAGLRSKSIHMNLQTGKEKLGERAIFSREMERANGKRIEEEEKEDVCLLVDTTRVSSQVTQDWNEMAEKETQVREP